MAFNISDAVNGLPEMASRNGIQKRHLEDTFRSTIEMKSDDLSDRRPPQVNLIGQVSLTA